MEPSPEPDHPHHHTDEGVTPPRATTVSAALTEGSASPAMTHSQKIAVAAAVSNLPPTADNVVTRQTSSAASSTVAGGGSVCGSVGPSPSTPARRPSAAAAAAGLAVAASSSSSSPPPPPHTIIKVNPLTPIESIAVHRHRHGGPTDDDVLIKELEFILNKAIGNKKGPWACRLDLYGPDTINVAKSPFALEFLGQFGFVQTSEEVSVPIQKRVSPASGGAAVAEVDDVYTQHDSPLYPNHINTAPSASSAASSPSSMAANNANANHHTVVRHYIQLSTVPMENSLEWQLFRASVQKGLEALKVARERSTGLLHIALHRFIFFQAMATPYRVEIVVKGSAQKNHGDASIVMPLSKKERKQMKKEKRRLEKKQKEAAKRRAKAAAESGAAADGTIYGGCDDGNDSFIMVADPNRRASGTPSAASEGIGSKSTTPKASAGGGGAEVDDELMAAIAAARLGRKAAEVTHHAASSSVSAAATSAGGAISSTAAAKVVEETHISNYFSLDDAIVLNSSSGPSPSQQSSSSAASAAAAAPLTLYQNMMASFNTTIVDGPCTIEVTIYRSRSIRGDKPKAVGTIAFDNKALLRREIDLKDPAAPAGLPIGRLTIEIESLRLRHEAIVKATRAARVAAGGAEHSDDDDSDADTDDDDSSDSSSDDGGDADGGDDKDGDGTKRKEGAEGGGEVPAAAPWVDQQAIIDAAAKRLARGSVGVPGGVAAMIGAGGVVTAGDYTHGRFDADDYF